MATILHITTRAEWDAARVAGSYCPPSLEREGFIHCSTHAQAVGSANKYFRGRTDLVLLVIDESRVAATLRYEPPAPIPEPSAPTAELTDPRVSELFPHLYGPLALAAVIRVVPFPCDEDGGFTLPAETSTASANA
jgi:uncharacterized protein (DUF952 family)